MNKKKCKKNNELQLGTAIDVDFVGSTLCSCMNS